MDINKTNYDSIFLWRALFSIMYAGQKYISIFEYIYISDFGNIINLYCAKKNKEIKIYHRKWIYNYIRK